MHSSWLRWLGVVVAVLWQGLVAAQTQPALSRDQMRAVLSGLGEVLLPEVKGKVEWGRVNLQSGTLGLLRHGGDEASVRGNGFLLGAAGAELRCWAPALGCVIRVKDGPLEEEPSDGADVDNAFARVSQGTFAPAKLEPDVTAVVAWFKKAGDASKDRSLEANYDPFGGGQSLQQQAQASALRWAVMLHRSGHDAEAMEVAMVVFDKSTLENRKSLVDSLVETAGQTRWTEVMSEFARTKDWAKLKAGAESVIRSFSIGWSGRDAARLVLKQVAARSGQTDTLLKIRGDLSQADRQELATWFTELEAGKSMPTGLWTIPMADPETADAREGETHDEVDQRDANEILSGPDVTAFPANRGLDAVPLLAAMLDDHSLVPQLIGSSRWSRSYGSDQTPADQLRARFSMMRRPASRADLAWQVLMDVVPALRQSGGEILSDRYEVVMDWYQSVKSLTPEELAMTYLEGASYPPRRALVTALKSKDPKHLSLIEDLLLEQTQAYSMELATTYVKLRKKDAGPFIDKVQLKLESDTKGQGLAADASMKKQIDGEIQNLRKLATGEVEKLTPEQWLARVAAIDSDSWGSSDWTSLRRSSAKTFAGLSEVQRLTMVINHLPQMKAQSLGWEILWDAMNKPGSQGAKSKPELLKLSDADRKQVLAATRPAWEKVLAPALMKSEDADADAIQANATASRFAWVLESLVTGTEVADIANQQASLRVLGEGRADVARPRLQALIKGEVPPPVPSANEVNDDQRQAMLADLAKLDGAGVAGWLKALPTARQLALFPELGKTDDWPAGLVAFNSTLQRVVVSALKNPAPWKALESKPVNAELCVTLAKLASQSDEPDVLTIWLSRSSPLVGWTLRVSQSAKPAAWMENQISDATQTAGPDFSQVAKRYQIAYAALARHQTRWQWTDAPIIPSADEKLGTSPPQDERLAQIRSDEPRGWTAVQSFFTKDASAPKASVSLQFMSLSTQRALELYPPAAPSF